MHFGYIPAGQSQSTVLCVHDEKPFYFAVRPTAQGGVATITVQPLKHSGVFCNLLLCLMITVNDLASGKPITGAVKAVLWKHVGLFLLLGKLQVLQVHIGRWLSSGGAVYMGLLLTGAVCIERDQGRCRYVCDFEQCCKAC